MPVSIVEVTETKEIAHYSPKRKLMRVRYHLLKCSEKTLVQFIQPLKER
jgi:hypothetical protein